MINPGTPAPPPVLSEEDARPETPSALPDIGERPLLSGWVRLFPSTQEKGDKVMMAATDLKLHAGGVSGNGSASPLSAGRVQIDADDIIAASAITPSPPPSRRFRFTITVRRWSGELSSPRLSPPSPPSMLRRGSEGILSLLSPLWRASRASLNRSLSVARPRRQSSLMQLQSGLEYVLEFDTSWEAEAWVEAIAESREALVRAAAERRWECVGRLLRSGRSPAAREANGRGALHYACGHGDYATVMALLEAGTPVCVAGASHRTHRLRRLPRLRPCLRPAPHPRAPNLAPPLNRRPPHPSPPPVADNAGVSPLGMAALQSHPHLVELLLDHRADPTTPVRAGQFSGKHPLDMARLVGAESCASALLRHSWLSFLPFQLRLRIASFVSPLAMLQLEATSTIWRHLMLTGRQLGILGHIPPPPEVCQSTPPTPDPLDTFFSFLSA